MNKADLDAIAERTAQEVAKELRVGMRLDAIEVCRMVVAWSDDENYHGRVVDWNDVVGAAQAVLTQVADAPQPDTRNDKAIALITRMADWLDDNEDIDTIDVALDAEAYLKKYHARRASSKPDPGPGACQAGNTGGDDGERPARSLDSLE